MTPELMPQNEVNRITALQNLSILDTQPEKTFDDITKRAAQICNTPIAGICLVDEERVWFKSLYGIDIPPIPRKIAFCARAILNPKEPFIVTDARTDSQFADNPSVTGFPHIVFYYGVPLVCPEGNALGTLCVIDHTPRTLTQHQEEFMRVLAHQAVGFIRLKKFTL